jgi:hypothetical protein
MTAMIMILCAGIAGLRGLAAESGADKKGMEVTYTSGTAPGVRLGVDGVLEATSPTALEFHSSSGDFSIPYAGITVARYREENRFRLGVRPAIGVGLLKARSKRHLMTITWKDEGGVAQAAIFESSRQGALALLTIVRVRAPQVCSVRGDCIGSVRTEGRCGWGER